MGVALVIAVVVALQGDDSGPSPELVVGLPDGVERVSVASDGSQGNDHSVNASISNDGRFVAFDSMASNLVEGDSGQLPRRVRARP